MSFFLFPHSKYTNPQSLSHPQVHLTGVRIEKNVIIQKEDDGSGRAFHAAVAGDALLGFCNANVLGIGYRVLGIFFKDCCCCLIIFSVVHDDYFQLTRNGLLRQMFQAPPEDLRSVSSGDDDGERGEHDVSIEHAVLGIGY